MRGAKCFWSSCVLDHEVRLAFGNDLICIGADGAPGHYRHLAPLFDASGLEQYSGTGGQGVPKAHLALGRVRTASLQKQPIGHHVIQNTEKDAAVCDAVISAVFG